MPMVSDKEYLSKPLLDGLVFNISEDRIYVVSSSTSFFNIGRIKRIKQEEVLENYKKLLHLAKEQGTKIRYSQKYKQRLLDIWPEYVEAVKEYNEIFDELKGKMPKLEKRGIHYGCSDDEYLKECTEFSYKLLPFNYSTSPISVVASIVHGINGHLSELEYCSKNSSMHYNLICL